jgi:Spy/CpxP family protein refolding chaperone
MAVMPPQAGMIDHLSDALSLTDDQATKLNKIITNGDETIRTLTQKSADASKSLRTAVMASKFDVQKVKDLAAAAQKAEAAVISASIDEWVQIRNVLTTDQVEKLQEMMTVQRPGKGRGPDGTPPSADGFPPPFNPDE